MCRSAATSSGLWRVLDRLQLAADLAEALHDAGEIDAGVGPVADRVDSSRFDPATEVGHFPGEARALRFDGKPQRVEGGDRIAGALAVSGIVHVGVMGHDGKPR